MATSEILSQRRELTLQQESRAKEPSATPGSRERLFPQNFFLIADFCLVWVSAGIAHVILFILAHGTRQPRPEAFFSDVPYGFLFLFSVMVILFADVRKLYEYPWKRSTRSDLKRLADSVIRSGIVVGIGSYLSDGPFNSAGGLLLSMALAWALMGAWRRLVRSQPIPGLEKRNILIVGYGGIAHRLRKQLEESSELGYIVKGFLCRRRNPRSGDKGNFQADGELLGSVNSLPDVIRAHFIDEIFISVPSDRHLVKTIAQKARSTGAQVRVVPDLYEEVAAEPSIEYIGRVPTLLLCQNTKPAIPLLIKRMTDVIFSGIALILLSPLFAIVACIIKLDSKGSVFYRSVRVGKKGVTFACYKFRTMVENADALKGSLVHLNERDQILFKIAADPRITRVGKYLRKFSIDELPQFWNVLRGEMSLVGPRPPACGEYTQYRLEHLRRLDVVPGVTGLWQVTARQDPSFQNYIKLDTEYVNNWSLRMDFSILCKTVAIVLMGTGQ